MENRWDCQWDCDGENINSGINDSDPSGMIVFKDKLIFKAEDVANGAELWETDGTSSWDSNDKHQSKFRFFAIQFLCL